MTNNTGKLHVVTTRYNPLRYKVPHQIYLEWAQHMLASGVELTVVECQLGDRPFECQLEGVRHIGVRTNSIVWTKENCLNLGISRLPHDWSRMAWIDSDIHFRDPKWVEKTLDALDVYDVIQPWSKCMDLGPQNEVHQVSRSFGSLWANGVEISASATGMKTKYEHPHPGYAWACTRKAYAGFGGLLEVGALGSGDHHMALALIGKIEWAQAEQISPAYARHLRMWQERALRAVNMNVGCVDMTIEHKFHGSKGDRRYLSRRDILVSNQFDPDVDLYKNEYGVWEYSGNKPLLRKQIDTYFRQRNEDSGVR